MFTVNIKVNVLQTPNDSAFISTHYAIHINIKTNITKKMEKDGIHSNR